MQEGEKGVSYSVKTPDKNQALRLLAEMKGGLKKGPDDEGAVSFHFHVPGMARGGKRSARAAADAAADAEPVLVGSGSAEGAG